MIDPKHWLAELGYRLSAYPADLTVYQATKGVCCFFYIDSQYEFDYLNEEAVVYLLASQQPVLIHVPLHARYEEYRASFSAFSGWPVQFFIQGEGDDEQLSRQLFVSRLQDLGLEEI